MNTLSFSSSDAARWTHGEWSNGLLPETLNGISTDSRNILKGSLFVALQGASHDAHRFVAHALASGAAAALVRKGAEIPGVSETAALLYTDNPNEALLELGHGWRKAAKATIVGVTGSAGKTTVKEMTAALLAKKGKTACTLGNFNNEIGLPISLLSMPKDCAFGVFEAGISHPHEMAPLARAMSPDVVVFSCIAPVHLAAFGSLEAIANEKADLLRALSPSGVAVLPQDDVLFPELRSACLGKVVTVAFSDASADYSASDVDSSEGSFTVLERATGDAVPIATRMPGDHNVRNALSAIAVARYLGVEWPDIVKGFLGVTRPPMRWQVMDMAGVTLINDAYNANPLSMEKALETFSEIDVMGRRFAVLGDMLELGERDEAELHRQVGRAAAKAGLTHLWLVGKRACEWIREGALEAGMGASRVTACASAEEAADRAHEWVRAADALLLKASRGLHFENVEKRLREYPVKGDALELLGIEAKGIVGILPEERVKARTVRVDVRMEGDLSRPATTDRIEDAVDYRRIVEGVQQVVGASSDGLIERLAQRVAEAVLEMAPGCSRVCVRVVKPEPMPQLAASACERVVNR